MSTTADVPPSPAAGPTSKGSGEIPPLSEINKTYNYKGVPMPLMLTPAHMEAISELEVREDDVILASFPKCGTHWMWEILGLIRNDGVPLTSEERRNHMSCLIELPLPSPVFKLAYPSLKDKPSPRLYVTHLPIQFLPNQIWQKKPKIVYISRNPKDSIASMYNVFAGYPDVPSWNKTFDQFASGGSPYGSFWSHALGYWKHRDDANVHFVRFEDLKKHTKDCISKVAAHVDHPLSPEAIENVVKYSSLEEMKASYAKVEEELDDGKFLTRAVGIFPFIKIGKVGGWKTLFTVAQNERLEQVMEEHLMGSGLEFQFKI